MLDMGPHRHSGFFRPLVGHMSWYAVSMGFNFIAGFVCFRLLWQSTALEGRQQYALLMIIVGLVLLLADFGLENGMVRFFWQNPGFERYARRLFTRMSLLVTLPVAIGVSVWWYYAFGNLAAVAAALMGYGHALFQITGAMYRSQGKVSTFVGWNTARTATITGLVALLYVSGRLTVTTWFAASGVCSVLAGFVVYFRHKTSAPLEGNGEPPDSRIYFSYLIPILIVNSVLWLEPSIDAGFLNRLHPLQLPGYRLLVEYCRILAFATLLVGRAWPTVYFRSAGGRPDIILNRLVGVSMVVGAGALVLYWVSPIGIHLLSGEGLTKGLAMPLALIVSANASAILVGVLRPHFEQTRRTRTLSTAYVLGLVVTLCGNFALVPRFAVAGTGLSALLTFLGIFWYLLVNMRENAVRRAAVGCAAVQVVVAVLMAASALALPRVLANWR